MNESPPMPDRSQTNVALPRDPLDTPPPSFTQTFSWADGEYEEHAWYPSDEAYTEEINWYDEPREMLVETWERTAVEVRTLYPPLVSCSFGDDDHEDDSVAWQAVDIDGGIRWMQACEAHRCWPETAGGVS